MKYLLLCLLVVGCDQKADNFEPTIIIKASDYLLECKSAHHSGYGLYDAFDCVSFHNPDIKFKKVYGVRELLFKE